MREHIVGHAHKRIFLSKHLAVLADKRQTVYIRINYDAEIISTILQFVHYASEILLQRFRIVGEIAGRFTVQELIFHAQTVEQFWQNDTSNRVDRVDAYFEMRFLYSFRINELQTHHAVNVLLVECVVFCI